MRRYLLVLDLAFAVLGASMAIGVGVSALLLAGHLDIAPEQQGSMNSLLMLTLAYTAVTVAAAASAFGLHRRQGWHWAAQAAFGLSVVASYFVSIQMLAKP